MANSHTEQDTTGTLDGLASCKLCEIYDKPGSSPFFVAGGEAPWYHQRPDPRLSHQRHLREGQLRGQEHQVRLGAMDSVHWTRTRTLELIADTLLSKEEKEAFGESSLGTVSHPSPAIRPHCPLLAGQSGVQIECAVMIEQIQ